MAMLYDFFKEEKMRIEREKIKIIAQVLYPNDSRLQDAFIKGFYYK